MKIVQVDIGLNNFEAVESDEGTDQLLRVDLSNGQSFFLEWYKQKGLRRGQWRVHPDFVPSELGKHISFVAPWMCLIGHPAVLLVEGSPTKNVTTVGAVTALTPCDYRDAFHDDLSVVT